MSKAVSGYVIALILVVLVIVVVGYLIITNYQKFLNTGKYTDCLGKKAKFCYEFKQSGSGSWDAYAPGCSGVGVKVDPAKDCT